MEKMTVYLPADLKIRLQRAARDRGTSEAQLIREAVGALVLAHRPAPRGGFLEGRGQIAADLDRNLEGFGHR